MPSTYAYDVVLGQLESATTQADVDLLVREYSIYVRGMLESRHPAAEVTRRDRPGRPGSVRHPVLGRDIDRKSDAQLAEAGARWAKTGHSEEPNG